VQWGFLLLSIPIGIIAARIDVLISWIVNRSRHGKLELRGKWVEWIPRSTDRHFSVGRIQFNVLRRRYEFNGTNYLNNGEPFCHWTTVTSYLDWERLEFHYVFATQDAASLQTTSYGYGVLHLVNDDGVLAPQDGYYIYSTANGDAVSMSHTLTRVGDLPPNRNANARTFLSDALPEHRDALHD
jgi:hypothetical protein